MVSYAYWLISVGKKVLCFFNKPQWEMIQETSSIAEIAIEEVVQGIVSDLDTVIFLNPEEFNF